MRFGCGAIDPPQPVGNIAATIQAPNLSISSNGVIQNVGNVIGTNVRLTGQSLINGITTANTYTPRVDGPSQVISLSPVNLPGLKLGTTGSGGTGASAVPGQASYMAGVLGGSATTLGPQQLLSELPASLQPSSTLFYYNPEAEDLMLQQAALKQTGQASFIGGLSYDRTNGLSVTDQEKGILYQNALDYAKQNNLQLGVALSQAQINELSKPMLWYVEQTVPDPSCVSTGIVTCKTVTALMPQVYLPSNSSSALSAGGNIIGQDVTLDFNQDGHGSILNTGTISASDTLTVNTSTLTNQANQVDVGQIWSSVKGGYIDTTGTVVQPGGFMSAANMDLNVQTLSQIGGALQKLNADGTLDQAGTQQMTAALAQQLGGSFTQMTLTDHLHTDFVKEGGFGFDQLAAMAAAVALSAMGMPVLGAMVSSTINQLSSGQGFSFGQVLEAGAVAWAVEGLDQGLGLNNLPLSQVGDDLISGAASMAEIAQGALEVVGTGLVSATVNTIAYGGSFGQVLENSVVSSLAAVAAGGIGAFNEQGGFGDGLQGQLLDIAAHGVLGCAASAAEGTGCAGGAIGGATSAAFTSLIPDPTDSNGNRVPWSPGVIFRHIGATGLPA